ncbi:hypothetical protein [Kitasatospora cheerisanensis]|uniref:Uncharacterized protein n=1 Tax=Kitasatospora cheerisanensis KCTC 2395 TaxID=1348663 RepID=A0A066Z6N3_9ACTN|nr:hypothetical protein [Kitasatospora cheerisanensis]KDN87899.1 hypothetical protein KCH_03120 [Kitasatospora cheerisanensis KCTC 2395]
MDATNRNHLTDPDDPALPTVPSVTAHTTVPAVPEYEPGYRPARGPEPEPELASGQPPAPAGGSRRSGSARLSARCAMALGVLGLLLAGVLGALLTRQAATDFSYQVGWRGTPKLSMTVDACLANGGGRHKAYNCYGHGERGTADTVDGSWLLRDAPTRYAPGTVLDVSCSPTGGCVELGTRHALADSAKFLFGLWLCSFVPGSGLVLLSVRRNAPPRRKGLSTPYRVGLAWFAVLPALALVLGLVSLFL